LFGCCIRTDFLVAGILKWAELHRRDMFSRERTLKFGKWTPRRLNKEDGFIGFFCSTRKKRCLFYKLCHRCIVWGLSQSSICGMAAYRSLLRLLMDWCCVYMFKKLPSQGCKKNQTPLSRLARTGEQIIDRLVYLFIKLPCGAGEWRCATSDWQFAIVHKEVRSPQYL
jgi:hypothetical protein